jgi:hypothetical protein
VRVIFGGSEHRFIRAESRSVFRMAGDRQSSCILTLIRY